MLLSLVSVTTIFYTLLLILDTKYDISGEELYHRVPATDRYVNVFPESYPKGIIA